MNAREREQVWLLEEKYGGEKNFAFFADVELLAAGEPLAYIIGHIPFLDTTIHLDSKPLIPRPETEYWVERAIEAVAARAKRAPQPLRILDLCAGSGCIGVAVLKALPMVRVDFCEIDAHHHATIEKNIRENGINPMRAHIFGDNLFEEIAEQYDYILTNPPYIDPEKRTRVEESVLAHEPHNALFGGKSGLALIERIIKEAPAHLTEQGALYIEHEPEQSDAVCGIAADAGFASCSPCPDQYGCMRFSLLARTV